MIVCPYCFKVSMMNELKFQCTNRRCDRFNEIFDISTNNRHHDIFAQECPDCGVDSYRVICPHCKNPLPKSTLNGNDMIISVIGARDAGKSNYMGVLIHELMTRVMPAFGGACIPFDTSLYEYNKRFGDPLYKANVKLPHTDSALNQDKDLIPMIFTLSFPRKRWLRNDIINYTFVFYDLAGEDLELLAGEKFYDFETANKVANYICNSKGIIFLLDPLNNVTVVNRLDLSEVDKATCTGYRIFPRSADILNNTTKLIKKMNPQLKNRNKIDIPVAVVLSKYDVIEKLIPDDAFIKKTSPHCEKGTFSVVDAKEVNEEVRGLLHDWNDIELIHNINVNYSKWAFFCSSAFGLNNNADDQGKINIPNPHRIEDAFLWILSENGVIPKNE